uniref:Poly(ADP-ribose) glycohydrolase n=1 Tax=Macrostomum lignano TaxID=282301 RepID=A0A1I8FLZ4_9PLAT
ESVNATLPLSLVMLRAISEFHARTGRRVGFKPAGASGLRRTRWTICMHLVQFALGPDWLQPNLLRIGASSLLGEIEKSAFRLLIGPGRHCWGFADGLRVDGAMGGSYSHSPLAQYDVASIVSSTGLSASNVRQLHQRYRQLCLRTCDGRPSATAPPADAPKLLSRRQLLSDPELSSNPLAERIVAAMFPGSADTLTFPEFCSAVAVSIQSPVAAPVGEVDKDKHESITNKSL